MNRENIVSFYRKHPPGILRGFNVRHLDGPERLRPGEDVRGVIETPKLLVAERNLDGIAAGGAVVYPGRHARDKHPRQQFSEAGIALYELDSSPWNRSTARFVFSALDALTSGIPAMQANMLRGEFDQIPRIELGADTQFGIVGLGNIGEMVMEQAQKRDYQVSYFSRTKKVATEQAHDVTYKSLEQLFAESDVISLHLPNTPETRGLINYDLLKRMKPHAILISTSASGVLNEADLLRKMHEDKTIKASLDTFEDEGVHFENSVLNPNKNLAVRELVLAGNLLLTPHTAYKTTTSSAELLHVLAGPFTAYAEEGYFPDSVSVTVPSLNFSTLEEQRGKEEVYTVSRVV